MGNGRAVEITAIADICEARRQAAHAMFPSARVYPNHASLLAAEAEGLDFVDIATPPVHHAENRPRCARHGLHVLCEKPLATNAEDAQAMLRHAREARRCSSPATTTNMRQWSRSCAAFSTRESSVPCTW